MLLVGDRAVETVTVSGCAITECLSAIDAHPDIEGTEVVDQRDTTATVQLETLEPTVLSAAARARTPLVYPARVNRGKLTVTVVGTHAAVSSLGEELRADSLGFEVAYIQSDRDGGQLLTDRQEEVLFTAIEHGYYKSPRECTLTDVADELGIAKSTCSATLQRIEEAIVEYFCSQRQRSDSIMAERRTSTVGGR